MKVAVDGYWLTRPARGMARFARMLIESLGEDALLLAPELTSRHPSFPEWEQIFMPRLAKRSSAPYLLCPFNTGPLWLRSRLSLILVLHDLIFMDKSIDASLLMYQNFGKYYRRAVVPRVARKAKRVITVSEYSKGAICRQFGIGEERVVVIPNAVSDTWFENVRCPNSERRYFLTVTGEAPSKNLARLIEAFSLLGPEANAHTLKIAGVRTSVHRHFETLAEERGVKDKIEFLHYVDDAQLRKLYGEADAYVCASLAEGFGIPLLEAMASGVPLVCSNTTSMPEVAGDAAWYCDPRDPASIARAMMFPLCDPLSTERKAQEGIKRASLFREGKVIARMKALWRELDDSAEIARSGRSGQ